MEELNEAIRLRLSCGEKLAPEMADYKIVDGRAVLSAPGLFEASVTLSGTDAQDRWYLLSIEFCLWVVGAAKDREGTGVEPLA